MYIMYSLFLYMLLVQFFVNHFGYKLQYVHNFNKISTPYRTCPDFLWSVFLIFFFLGGGVKSVFIFITCSVYKHGTIQRHLLTKLPLSATLPLSMFLPVCCYIPFTLCDWWWWMPQVSSVQMKCRYS